MLFYFSPTSILLESNIAEEETIIISRRLCFPARASVSASFFVVWIVAWPSRAYRRATEMCTKLKDRYNEFCDVLLEQDYPATAKYSKVRQAVR